jgi:hypothetical protein
MSYTELTDAINRAQRDLDNAVTQDEINYFGMQLMILEDRMANIISRGRR